MVLWLLGGWGLFDWLHSDLNCADCCVIGLGCCALLVWVLKNIGGFFFVIFAVVGLIAIVLMILCFEIVCGYFAVVLFFGFFGLLLSCSLCRCLIVMQWRRGWCFMLVLAVGEIRVVCSFV
ncbi:MAG: hypothetical protein O7C59_09460 [Rickettsia endosymbiont of Ixodes persulcatus]|nr:hypothetical protein [Rickettsia endosymbiont of Ixodes persulcatus]